MNILALTAKGAAIRISALYALLGGLWIFFSDKIVELLLDDPVLITRVSMVKGWFFIGVTAVLLYVLIRRALRRIDLYQTALSQSEKKYRALFEGSRDALILQGGADWAFVSANTAAKDLLGAASEHDLEGLCLAAVSPELQPDGERSRDRADAEILRTLDQGSRSLEWRCRRRDGAEFDATLLLTRIDLGGEVAIQATLRDETERIRFREALQASEEKYRELVENANSIILRCDSQGNVTFLNEYGEAFFGFTEEELLGKNVVGTIVPSRDSSGRDLGPIVRDVFASPEQFRDHENENVTRDGRRVWVRWTNKSVRDDEGNLRGVLSIGTDVTERKRSEAERLELERTILHTQKLESLGVLAGGIAHDFNNLLTAIIGNLDLALRELSPASSARTSLGYAMQASHRAADLTRQMLAYSGKGPSFVSFVGLSQLVEENAHLLRASIPKNVTLELHLEPDLPPAPMDSAQVQQVVMNLITNASEAVGDRAGVVSLTTGRQACNERFLSQSRLAEKPPPGNFLFVEVKDTGCGMDAETQQKLFDPFFTTKFTGRGLGMSAVLGIVRSHGGAILVQSASGSGTAIRVLFPEVPEGREQPAAPPTRDLGAEGWATHEGPRGTVLVVDDEDFVRDFCRTALERFGYRVLVADNGEQAVRVYRENEKEVDCVILDLTMPVMDGRTALAALRTIRPDVKVVLATGFRDGTSLDKAPPEGLAGFIYKPYRLEELGRVVEKALGGRDGPGEGPSR